MGLAVVLTNEVWESLFDISRAVAPVLTAFVLLVFVRSKRGDESSGVGHQVRDVGAGLG